MGDVATLAEQAEKAFDGDSAKKLEEKFIAGEEFTLDDFSSRLKRCLRWDRWASYSGCCQAPVR
jgi:signal recognition particle subunit SRP54